MEDTVPRSSLSDLPPEERLLLAATRPSGGVSLNGVDPVRLIRLALRNKVVGRCRRLLNTRFDGWEELGSGWAKLGRLTSLQERRETRRHRECVALVRDLTAAGLACCPLKGTFLSLHLYDDATLRDTTDIDLLVRLDRLAEAVEVVQRKGYELPPHQPVPRSARHRAFLARVKGHHFAMNDRERGFQLELHWALSYHRRLPGEADGGLWDHLEPVRRSGVRFHRMRAPYELLYLALHGAQHQWNRLSWLADFAGLATRCPDAVKGAESRIRADDLAVVWNAACLLADSWYATDLQSEDMGGLIGRRARYLVEEAMLFRDDPHPSPADLRRYERAACDTRVASLRVVFRRYLLPSVVEVRSPADLHPVRQAWRALVRKLQSLLPASETR